MENKKSLLLLSKILEASASLSFSLFLFEFPIAEEEGVFPSLLISLLFSPFFSLVLFSFLFLTIFFQAISNLLLNSLILSSLLFVN